MQPGIVGSCESIGVSLSLAVTKYSVLCPHAGFPHRLYGACCSNSFADEAGSVAAITTCSQPHLGHFANMRDDCSVIEQSLPVPGVLVAECLEPTFLVTSFARRAADLADSCAEAFSEHHVAANCVVAPIGVEAQ
jgi:hypothetical protein